MPSKPLIESVRRTSREIGRLRFGDPVTHVYNPLEYAWRPHRRYLERFAGPGKEVVLLGMNPGPHGMAQTGIPFGAASIVRDWLGIEERVDRPAEEHPRRPVKGFDVERDEVSGMRLWGWARDTFGTPEAFFRRFFVANYCPLCFLEESGRNRTPDKLTREERDPLFELCDRMLRLLIDHLDPRRVVGVGAFAERRARAALADRDLEFGRILHPSPASPSANQGWAEQASEELRGLGVRLPD
jgi:single-strand selective monofunctional uracil DNA glycosylase